MTLRRLGGGAAAAAPLALLWHAAFAATLDVNPVLIDIAPSARSAELQLTNLSKEQVSLQVDVRAWSQDVNGAEQLSDTRAVLAVPPLVTIPPGERQIVRIGRLGEVDLDVERSFRVLVTELSSNTKPAGAPTNLDMRMQLSIPVFIAPISRPVEPEVVVDERLDVGEGLRLVLHNTGNAHAKLSEVVVRSDGTWITLPAEALYAVRYVLPDARAQLAIPQDLGDVTAIRIRTFEGKEWEYAVPPPQ
jgi:fimbrial chaperone protein